MKNRIIKIIISSMLIFGSFLSLLGKSEAKKIEGIAGYALTYTVDTEKRILKLEGEGTLGDYMSPDTLARHENIRHMHWIVGEGITRINRMNSLAAYYMESIELPSSLKTIDDGAFSGCWRLMGIEIPKSVETIGKTAFRDCEWLKTVINHSGATIYLPSHPDFSGGYKYSREIPYEYYVDGKLATTVPPGKTAVGKARKYRVNLESEGGTLSKYNVRQYTYYRFGEPLKLPTVKWKGRIFCGWTAKKHSNYAWRTITNKDTENPYGTTRCWAGTKTLYAQFIRADIKKLGKKKLKVSLSKWREADFLEIQYSTNKNFTGAKLIKVENKGGGRIKVQKKHKFAKVKYNMKKSSVSLTVSKLKAKKTYYFRFRFSGYDELNEDTYVYAVGDWFKKSVKM